VVAKTGPSVTGGGGGRSREGVGCLVQGMDGKMWGKVVDDGGHQWILKAAGRVAAKGDENVRWRWLPPDHPSALVGHSRRKGKVGGAGPAGGGNEQQIPPQVAISKRSAGRGRGRGKARREVPAGGEQQQQQLTALQREYKRLQAEVARLAAEGRQRKAAASASGPSLGRVVTVSQRAAAGRRGGGRGGRGGGRSRG
jgi:hypothetical protein